MLGWPFVTPDKQTVSQFSKPRILVIPLPGQVRDDGPGIHSFFKVICCWTLDQVRHDSQKLSAFWRQYEDETNFSNHNICGGNRWNASWDTGPFRPPPVCSAE